MNEDCYNWKIDYLTKKKLLKNFKFKISNSRSILYKVILTKGGVGVKEFVCPKCNSKDLFTKANGNQIGLYCGDCGKWIEWLSKDESRIFDEQQKRNLDVVDKPNNKIQCAACGYLTEEKDWYNSSIHGKIKICPKCGTLRFIHDNNKGYRKESL